MRPTYNLSGDRHQLHRQIIFYFCSTSTINVPADIIYIWLQNNNGSILPPYKVKNKSELLCILPVFYTKWRTNLNYCVYYRYSIQSEEQIWITVYITSIPYKVKNKSELLCILPVFHTKWRTNLNYCVYYQYSIQSEEQIWITVYITSILYKVKNKSELLCILPVFYTKWRTNLNYCV
jgi:Ni,Fe-hydrogenase III component G